jgi:hypothetical protein
LPTPLPGPAPAPAATNPQPGPNPNNGIGANSQAPLDAWFDACEQFGKDMGAGDTSRLGWIMDLAERASRKMGDGFEVTKDDIAAGYDRLVSARAKRNAAMPRPPKDTNGKDRGVRISEAKRIVHVVQLPHINGFDVLNRTMKVMKGDKTMRGESDALVLKVARAQSKRPQVPYSDAEILVLLSPVERDEKDEADLLQACANRIKVVCDKVGWNPHSRAAFGSLNARITELGGTSAQRLANEKMKEKEAKLQAKASNKGKVKRK